MEFFHKDSINIKPLVEFGIHGHFPIFETNWLEEFNQTVRSKRKLNGNEKSKVKKLLARLATHRSLSKQKVVFSSMSPQEQTLVTRALFSMIEDKIMDKGTTIH